jgi:predicted Zn-dependent peptidase
MLDWILHENKRLEEAYYETRHPNGLRIRVAPKELSAAYAILGVEYGSRDRFAGGVHPAGVAHFLEHKMFERADGNGWEDDFSALGAEVNAYTSDDCTAYMFSATERVDEALEALLRMVSELSVTKASVARERGIIAEEIRMNADDPWEVAYANMLRGLYPPVKRRFLTFAGNPVREEICGTVASIRRITPAVLRRAHARFYTPANMVLAVSGRITPAEVEAVAERVWPSADPAAPWTPPPSRRARKPVGEPTTDPTADRGGVYKPRVTVSMETAKPLFSIGIKLPQVPDAPTELARLERRMTLLSEILFSRSGDLYDKLFEEGLVSPGISYGSSLGRPSLGSAGDGYGYFYLSGECDDPDRVYEAFTRYAADLTQRGIDRDAFTRARRTMYADYVYGFDSTEGIASALMTTALDGVGLYDPAELDRAITREELSDLLRTAFQPSQYTLSTVMPREG